MPLDLPPTHPAAADSAVPDSVRRASLGTDRTLEGAYAATATAMGTRWEQVQLTVPGKDLPTGLAALLARHNPALARLAGTSHGRFLSQTELTLAQQRQLESADRQALTALAQAGWLTQAPQVRVDGSGHTDGGATAGDWAQMANSQVTLAVDAIAPLRKLVAPDAQQDPVMLRWFTLFHEAAHAQLGQIRAPFAHPGFTAEQNLAMNRLGFEQPDLAVRPTPLFAENFADSYAALLLLRLTGSSDQATRTLDYILQVRQVASEHRTQAMAHMTSQGAERALDVFDPHATEGALRALRADLVAGTLDLEKQTPATLQALAQRYASLGTVAFLQSPEGQLRNDFGWAPVALDPANGSIEERSELLSDLESTRAQESGKMRFTRFAMADMAHQDTVTAPLPANDPMLQALAAQDAAFYQAYRRLPAAERAVFNHAVRELDVTFDPKRAPTLNALFLSYVQTGMDALAVPGMATQAARAMASDYHAVQAGVNKTLGQALGLTAPGKAAVATAPSVALRPR